MQRTLPVGATAFVYTGDDADQTIGLPHDGTEPMRRMVRWVIDQSVEPV